MTQLLWKSTEEMGCGVAKEIIEGKYFVVCNYNPAGNTSPLFKKNVPDISQAQIDAADKEKKDLDAKNKKIMEEEFQKEMERQISRSFSGRSMF